MKKNGIAYIDKLFDLEQPIITVYKKDQKWFPVEVYPYKYTMLMSFGEDSLGYDDSDDAVKMAEAIALIKGTDCIPSIGLSIFQNQAPPTLNSI